MIGILSARQIHLWGFFVHKAFWIIRWKTVSLAEWQERIKGLKNENQKYSVNTTGFKHFLDWLDSEILESQLNHPNIHLHLRTESQTCAMKRNSVWRGTNKEHANGKQALIISCLCLSFSLLLKHMGALALQELIWSAVYLFPFYF